MIIEKSFKFRLFIIFLSIFLLSSEAYANIIWPAVILEERLLSWWTILAGLVIEYFFVRKFTNFSVKKTVAVVVLMNFASTLAGILFIPLFGIIWEFPIGMLLHQIFSIGSFHPISWVATCLLAALANVIIELPILVKGFKIDMNLKNFIWVYAANALSVIVAIGSFLIMPASY